jgi:hypothetical protein
MTTQTICDFPECGKTAVWKVELSDITPHVWGDLSFTISSGTPQPRREMDVCAKHLPRVTFDLNEIAEFDRAKSA